MNNTLKKIIWITTAVAIVSLGIAAVLFFTTGMGGPWESGKGITVDERRSFGLNGIEDIEVRTSSTDVFLGAGEGNTIVTHLHGTVYTGQADAIPALAAEEAGEVIAISTERKDGLRWVLGFFSSDLILEIQIPNQYRGALVVHTSSGDVEISDQILSELSVETSSGTMQLHSIQAATITLDSSSGDQTVEGINAGHSQMSSSSGEIQVKDLQGGAKAESSSGDITLRYGEFDSDLEVRSSSGDVELFLTEAAEFHVEARASSGDIDCAFPVTLSGADSEMRRNRLFGTVGEGTHKVVVQTSSGDITIRP
jgi:lia operon protein LiaG